ncbi:extracellular solute-binding protein [Cohnella zeiphila]|uniref:Extracellular solute-binding protein n=1 Tax=Cohnella zeiphila TaxID=2761120 RepID=A0A7X0SL78_9BACL|nr:extracellular solute-binding protein [Cohnella zeiphila]MBB6730859.1 extracellular solute-binding protein [Cohnella zeiphila]
MRGYLKTVTFAALSCSLALAAGCSSGSDGDAQSGSGNQAPSGGSQQAAAGGVKAGGFPIVDRPITLKAFSRKDPQHGEYKDMLLWKDYEQKSGIHIEWDTPNLDSATERINLLFSTQDLPDFILKNSLTSSQIMQYGSQGLIIPLEKYIDQYAPHFKSLLDKRPDIKQQITAPDGHIYFLPSVMDYLPSNVGRYPLINTKWLSKVGMQAPTTSDELLKVLTAFKTQDPSGNGENEEIPYSAHNINLAFQGIEGMFGLSEQIANFHTVIEDGKANVWLDDDRYKKALEFFKQLYDQKLVDQEIFTQTDKMYFGKLADGIIGYTPLYQPRNAGKYANDYDAIVPPKGPDGDQVWAYLSNGVGVGNFMITKNDKYPEATVRWADYFFSDEGATAVYEVKEGEVYTVAADGTYHINEDLLNSDSGFENVMGAKYTYYPGGGALGLFTEKQMLPTMEGTPMPTYIKKVQDYLPKTVYNAPLLEADKQDKLTDLSNDIGKYADEMRAKFILGKVSFDDWDSYVKQLDKMGIHDMENILSDAVAQK